MYYVVYQTTNLLNNKIYVGSHKTFDINDDYMGSGKVFRRAMLKYGVDNFRREIIAVFDNPKDMYELEALIVTDDFTKRADTYNLKEGGKGGFDYLNGAGAALRSPNRRQYAAEGARAFSDMYAADPEFRGKHQDHLEKIKGRGVAVLYEKYPGGVKRGTKLTLEQRQRISDGCKGKKLGSANPMSGRVWVYSLTEQRSTTIDAGLLPMWLNLGWIKGRRLFK